MTHDTPGEEGERRWCEHCQIAVEPEESDTGPACPACGRDLS
jgi:predicted RNA-binding Zn-ribbon protein involved in translation (DUF1610 family)